MSSSRGKRGMKDPRPPPPKKFVDVFALDVGKLSGEIGSKGTHSKLILDIKNGVIKRTKSEWEQTNKSERRTPQDVHGKPVLPRTDEVFVVAVTNCDAETVHYLFNWNNLYSAGWYVDECWYLFEGTDKSTLPPTEQFNYVAERGKGLYELSVSCSYAHMGKKELVLGPAQFNIYVHKCFIIRTLLQRSREKLKLDAGLKSELQNGPLSFPAVVISEPSRFLDYQVWLGDNISSPTEVPKRFYQFFTDWSTLAFRLSKGLGFTLYLEAQGEDNIVLTADQVREKIALVPWGSHLFPTVCSGKSVRN